MQFLGLFSLTAQPLSERNCWSALARSAVGFAEQNDRRAESNAVSSGVDIAWMKGTFMGFKTKAGLCFRPEVTVRNWTPENTTNEESN